MTLNITFYFCLNLLTLLQFEILLIDHLIAALDTFSHCLLLSPLFILLYEKGSIQEIKSNIDQLAAAPGSFKDAFFISVSVLEHPFLYV